MEEMRFVEPEEMSHNEFPAASDVSEGMRTIRISDDPELGCLYIKDVVYAERSGEKQHLQILIPQKPGMEPFTPDYSRWPLVLYIPGSAFHRQEIYAGLFHMMDFCRRGYVVAVVEYRPSEIAAFPAQTQDAKTAIRFMRKNAEEFHVIPEKVALWGDSSGGHTALMCGITGDSEPDTKDYPTYSSAVNCIIDWFAPTDISRMNCAPSTQDHRAPDSPEGFLIGQKAVLDNPDLAQKVNLANYLSHDRPIPPILMMHGDKDRLVPFNQSVLLYEKLKSQGKDVEFYKLLGSDHAWIGFFSRYSFDMVDEFIRRKLGL